MRFVILTFLMVLGFVVTPVEAAQNKHAVAVIIGNKTYHGRIPAVDYAHNDAEAIKRYVIDVLGYRDGNIIDLRNASKAQIEGVFGNKDTHKGKLFNWMRPGRSDVTVFYSGHGVPGMKDKQGYLLPVDGDANLAEITGYSLDLLYKNLGKLPAKSVTVYLDTCFSGNTNAGMVVRGTSGISVTAKPIKASLKLTVLTAAAGDQVASWDDKAKHGLFTNYLLDALYGKADNGDGQVTLAEVQGYLSDEMSYQARRRYGREQTPTIQGKKNTVLVAYGGKAPKRPKQQVASLTPPKLEFDVSAMDEELVAVKTANVRSEPSTQSDKIDRLKSGSKVDVTGKTKVSGTVWYQVVLADRRTGYVFSKLLGEKPTGPSPAAVIWMTIQESQRIVDFETFIRNYPQSPFTNFAKNRLKELENLQAAALTKKMQRQKHSHLSSKSKNFVTKISNLKNLLNKFSTVVQKYCNFTWRTDSQIREKCFVNGSSDIVISSKYIYHGKNNNIEKLSFNIYNIDFSSIKLTSDSAVHYINLKCFQSKGLCIQDEWEPGPDDEFGRTGEKKMVSKVNIEVNSDITRDPTWQLFSSLRYTNFESLSSLELQLQQTNEELRGLTQY